MADTTLSSRLMACPHCGWQIPKVLVCSGQNNVLHEGLPFRSVSDLLIFMIGIFWWSIQCSKCSYFEMLNEHQAAAVGFTFPSSEFTTPNSQHKDHLLLAGRTSTKYADAYPPRHPPTPLKSITKPCCLYCLHYNIHLRHDGLRTICLDGPKLSSEYVMDSDLNSFNSSFPSW